MNVSEAISSTHRANSSKCPNRNHPSITITPLSQVGKAHPSLLGAAGVPLSQEVTNVSTYGKDCKRQGDCELCSLCQSSSVHRVCVPSEIEQLWCMNCIFTLATNRGGLAAATTGDAGLLNDGGTNKRKKM